MVDLQQMIAIKHSSKICMIEDLSQSLVNAVEKGVQTTAEYHLFEPRAAQNLQATSTTLLTAERCTQDTVDDVFALNTDPAKTQDSAESFDVLGVNADCSSCRELRVLVDQGELCGRVSRGEAASPD
eukprot:1304213-Amphidinium_carterae.1